MSWCVCVPARNEEQRLSHLLEALARQDIDEPVRVVVALNNTTDASEDVAQYASRQYPGRLQLLVDRHDFAVERPHAGLARRRAMNLGARWLHRDPAAILISTDADTRPPNDWIQANLACIGRGADLVGGRLVLDEAEPLPPAIAQSRAQWATYWARVREIEDGIDPSDWDPPPRHGDHTGASLAITVEAYEPAGGVPRLETGEDTALVRTAVAHGRRLVHPLEVWTRVSPRLDGRATDGMSADIKQLYADASRGRPQIAPALDHWRQRFIWRRELRGRLGLAAAMAAEARLPAMPRDMPLQQLDTC